MPEQDKVRVSAAFDRAAQEYDSIARFQQSVSDSLLNYLSVFAPDASEPSRILDGGCGTGYGSGLLARKWFKSEITGCDLSPEMLKLARGKNIHTVCADLEELPFLDSSFDFVWSSLALQWCRTESVFAELHRVMSETSLLLFATLGPGTLTELDYAFSAIDTHQHVRQFASPEEIGLALVEAGFGDIVMENETRTLKYPDFHSFLTSVRGIGANQVGGNRRRSMMGKNAWQNAQSRYESLADDAGMLPATYEIIFGCAAR